MTTAVGIAVQADGGADRGELGQVAETALRHWPWPGRSGKHPGFCLAFTGGESNITDRPTEKPKKK